MIKLLIVDDDKLTRNNIKRFLSNNLMCGTEIKTADDGIKGLEMILEHSVDIIISDVKMTGMDGLTFGEKLMQIGFEGHIIYISGYADKDILLKSIKIGAVNFLEKPVEPQELLDTVNRCISQLTSKHESLIYRLVMDRERSNLYSRIARQLVVPTQSLEGVREDLTLSKPAFLAAKEYFLVMLYLPGAEEPKFDGMIDSPVQRLLSLYPNSLVFHENNKTTAIITGDFSQNHEQRRNHLEGWLRDGDWESGTVGTLSASVRNLEELPALFRYQTAILQSAYFCDGVGVIDDCVSTTLCTPEFNRAVLMMHNAILSSSRYEFDQASVLLDEAIPSSRFCWYSDGALAKTQLDSLLDELSSRIAPLPSLPTVKKLPSKNVRCFLELLRQTWQSTLEGNASKGQPTNLFVAIAVRYIQRHLEGGISLNDVAGKCNISPSYLNNLFKREMGVTVGSYILSQKLTYAEILLLENKLSVKEIASLLGFYDANHFIKVFKRTLNLTPMQYRQKRRL